MNKKSMFIHLQCNQWNINPEIVKNKTMNIKSQKTNINIFLLPSGDSEAKRWIT